MRRTALISRCSFLALLPLVAAGCVDQNKYDALLQTNRSLQEQLVTVEDERDSARANLQTVREQLSVANATLDGLQKKYNLTDEEFQALLRRYDELAGQVGGMAMGPLPEDVEAALRDLAAAYPDVLSFDAKRGMLRFSSDFTFDLGSDALNPTAQNTLVTLAKILNSPNAQDFEVNVVGHTDNVRIGKDATRQQHPTNMHLSVHRAIAVRSALVNSGVAAPRFEVAGYGEYRPVVANPAKGGAKENRRVEIFLRPMPANAELGTRTVTGAETDEPMK